MEVIIDQIRAVLDAPLVGNGFTFNARTLSYSTTLDKKKETFYGYYFDIRKKIGGDYYFLDISLRVLHEKISEIANAAKTQVLNEREIPRSLKASLSKDIKANQTITGVYDWREVDDAFTNDVTVWACSIHDLAELKDYKKQLLFLLNKGQEWISKANDWEFLIKWALTHSNALQALSILKYLQRRNEFAIAKKEAIENYQKLKYPIEELNRISY
ncbi:MAG TPA: hypothetical protein VGB56_14645 [Flavisolibacter sp.]|jgi:hypothetical protein